MSEPASSSAARARLAREMEHHQAIADRAELIWNWDSPSGRRRAQRRASLFIEFGGLGPGVRALEIGCGTGLFTDMVARSGAEIQAVDLSIHLLGSARARTRSLPNVRLACGNAEETPFRAASFDAVYGSSVLHHLDLQRALAEAARLLRPGGRVVFTEPNIVNPQVALMFHLGLTKKYFGVSPDERAFSRRRGAAALRGAGFTAVSVRPFDFLHPVTPEPLCEIVSRWGGRLERVPVLREFAGSLLLVGRKPGG